MEKNIKIILIIFTLNLKKFKVSFLPFLLDGIALKPEYNLADGKHPNSKGVNLISKNLEKKLIGLIVN